MRRPKLRDAKERTGSELYPLGEFPQKAIYEISRRLVYNFAIGKADISGEDWGNIFASSINGKHLARPLGLADVVFKKQAWSVKSVKNKNPHSCKKIRIISGRNSPDYSYGISEPRKNLEETGKAIINIWNERINIALDKYDYMRTVILIRNINKLEFTLFETETNKFIPGEYEWRENKNGNLEGINKVNKEHKFTWQPSGGQFTIIYSYIPASAVRFRMKRPLPLDRSCCSTYCL